MYEQTKKDFEHIEEKYLKAKKLIKELQDRYVQMNIFLILFSLNFLLKETIYVRTKVKFGKEKKKILCCFCSLCK
jgi:hypothetical protein